MYNSLKKLFLLKTWLLIAAMEEIYDCFFISCLFLLYFVRKLEHSVSRLWVALEPEIPIVSAVHLQSSSQCTQLDATHPTSRLSLGVRIELEAPSLLSVKLAQLVVSDD
jgi:hypothetical protein